MSEIVYQFLNGVLIFRAFQSDEIVGFFSEFVGDFEILELYVVCIARGTVSRIRSIVPKMLCEEVYHTDAVVSNVSCKHDVLSFLTVI